MRPQATWEKSRTPARQGHSKDAWAASDIEREVTASPDFPFAFHGTKWHTQLKSRMLFQQHHQHTFLGEPFTIQVAIFTRILWTAICFRLGKAIYKGCVQSYIKKNSSLIGPWMSRHFKEGKRDGRRGGKEGKSLIFQTYFKPRKSHSDQDLCKHCGLIWQLWLQLYLHFRGFPSRPCNMLYLPLCFWRLQGIRGLCLFLRSSPL